MNCCEICSQPPSGGDVLCITCRETITRLEIAAQEQMAVPIAGVPTKNNTGSKLAAKQAENDSPKPGFLQNLFSMFKVAKTAELKQYSASQNSTRETTREK